MNPGNPQQAAQFSISNIMSDSTGANATVTCTGSNDCSVFCEAPPWVYISGASIPAFNGIWETKFAQQSGCAMYTISIVPLSGTSFPASATSTGGVVYSGAHLPVLLPFESQNCQGSFQTICSAELWEESLDWTYGTNTVSGTTGNTNSTGETDYQNAINNFLLGLPSATSMHNNLSTNNMNQY